MKQRILIVEDDTTLARVLSDSLMFEGFDVECAADAHLAVAKARKSSPDLIILDVMLPDGDGFDLCGLLRQDGATPVIMLTARAQKLDKLRGLSSGADDYVTKPFDFDELLARIQAVLRRTRSSLESLTMGAVVVDFRRLRATRGASALRLSHREFALLHYLAQRQGRVVSRHELLSRIWSYADAPLTRSVDHAVVRLRKKTEPDPANPHFIHSIQGVGYSLTGEAIVEPSPIRRNRPTESLDLKRR